MKAANAATIAALAGQVMKLATCWRVIRRDGVEYFFTDHNRDLVVGGDTYLAGLGFARTAISNKANLAVDDLEIEAFQDAATITERDVRAGLWDYAEVRVFVVGWDSPDSVQIKLRRGWLGEVTTNDRQGITAELRGLTAKLAQKTGELFTPECRAQFGDSRCKLNLASYTVSGTVGTVTNRAIFTVPGITAPTAGSYVGGVAHFTSGLNAGAKREILEWNGTTATLFLPVPYVIAPGDAVSLVIGCDKRLATCKLFGNVVNFRGEPYVPGVDSLMAVGGR